MDLSVSRKIRYSLGIDPGKTNLGWALVEQSEFEDGAKERSLIYSETLDTNGKSTLEVVQKIFGRIDSFIDTTVGILDVRIERYVAYNNVLTKDAERIIMLIGALDSWCQLYTDCESSHNLVRAIDWKRKLVQQLHLKYGFENPSQSLDKKFSIAAAKACIPNVEFKTDHEADAICLACLPLIIP